MNNLTKNTKKLKKAILLLYDVEDFLLYENKKLGRIITELQKMDLEIEIEKADKRYWSNKCCDECSQCISLYKYRKNKGLCDDCIEAIN